MSSANSKRWSRPCTSGNRSNIGPWCTTTPGKAIRRTDCRAAYRQSWRITAPFPAIPGITLDFTGCGQHPQYGAPAFPATSHGQPALLGHRDACGRLSLRSRLRARPGTRRRRSTGRLLRHDISGPDARPHEIDRRTLDSARADIKSQLSTGVDGMERQVSRHGAQSSGRAIWVCIRR